MLLTIDPNFRPREHPSTTSWQAVVLTGVYQCLPCERAFHLNSTSTAPVWSCDGQWLPLRVNGGSGAEKLSNCSDLSWGYFKWWWKVRESPSSTLHSGLGIVVIYPDLFLHGGESRRKSSNFKNPEPTNMVFTMVFWPQDYENDAFL